jgi:effector-binding domain-containing protein
MTPDQRDEQGHDVALLTVEASPIAAVAAVTSWDEFPSLWGKLLDEVWAVIRAGGAEKAGHNVMLYKDDRPSVEVGVQVAGPFEPVGRVVPSALPAGRVAATVHRGSYAGLGAAHDAVHRWATDNGHTLTGVRWEIYGDPSPDDPSAPVAVEIRWQVAG